MDRSRRQGRIVDQVQKFRRVVSIDGYFDALTLTNDIQFLCDKYGVRGFATSDAFFNSQALDIASFMGKWKLSPSIRKFPHGTYSLRT